MKPKPKREKYKRKSDYITVIQSEVMLQLGQRIHVHRQLLNNIMSKNIEQLEELGAINVIVEVDGLYQASLDAILDSLSDCLDMNLAKESLSAIKDSMYIRRGLVKFEKTT